MAEKDNKLTIALVVVVGLLAIVAIVISAVSLAKNMPPTVTVNNPSPSGGAPTGSMSKGQGGQQPIIVQMPSVGGPMAAGEQGMYRPPMGPNGRIYSLQVAHDYGSHQYFDDAGYLNGFILGLIDLVCKEAEIDCRIMLDTIFDNCWYSEGEQEYGGQGLHDRWYDGCSGWYTTVGRSQFFQFSQPYLKQPAVQFITLSTKAFNTDRNSVMNSKIVIMHGYASNEQCLIRQTGAIMPRENLRSVPLTTQVIDLLNNGYDAVFVTVSTFNKQIAEGTMKTVGPEYSCMIAGSAIMSRKDSTLTAAWNRGFTKLKNSGRFKKFCKEANAEHIERGTVNCIDSF